MHQLSRRHFLSASMAGAMTTMLGTGFAAARNADRPNILFIPVDDLRPVMGCYGGIAKTPAMDALARRGTVFNRAYCQQAVCSPSRTSLMTGRRPDTTKIYNLEDHFRDTIPDVVTLSQHFKNNGYHAQATGKIYHGGLDDKQSWSEPHKTPPSKSYSAPIAAQLAREKADAKARGVKDVDTAVRGPAWEAVDWPDEQMNDGVIANRGIEMLREHKDTPFFLACGFLKPHLPFVAPRKYYDMYPLDQLKLAANRAAPKNVPPVAMHTWGELRRYKGMPKQGDLTDQQALELVRGYYAATSFMDAQLGRLLTELENLDLLRKTVIVLWGDHGWHLGENSLWCKHSNFEIATRAPLIVSAPGQKNPGAATNALVEFVDIYPSLCELAGLKLPDGLEGTSFTPVMSDPNRPWKKAAFSQYPRARGIMGYSMRTDRYRYTEWRPRGQGKPEAVELYDHAKDPGETENLAARDDLRSVVDGLAQQMKAGWKGNGA